MNIHAVRHNNTATESTTTVTGWLGAVKLETACTTHEYSRRCYLDLNGPHHRPMTTVRCRQAPPISPGSLLAVWQHPAGPETRHAGCPWQPAAGGHLALRWFYHLVPRKWIPTRRVWSRRGHGVTLLHRPASRSNHTQISRLNILPTVAVNQTAAQAQTTIISHKVTFAWRPTHVYITN